MLGRFLKWLSGRLRPKLVRGDVGFGNEAVIACCVANRVPYLVKVRRTRLVRDLFRLHLADPSARGMRARDGSAPTRTSCSADGAGGGASC